MHTSRSRPKRHGGNGEDDEDLLITRVDDTHSLPPQYTHQSESYRASTTPARTTFDMSREASSSRPHRAGDDWRPVEPSHSSVDRYNYSSSNDTYHRNSRDDYDVLTRDTEGWANRTTDSRHSSGREWTQRYDHSYSKPAYSDSSSWAPSTSYDDRSANYDKWHQDDNRNPSAEERSRGRLTPEEMVAEKKDSGWHDYGRRDNRAQGWRRDSGWDTRRSEGRGKGVWNESRRWNAGSESARRGDRGRDERSWEPTSTWSGHNNDGHSSQRYQQGRRGNQNKPSKGKKISRQNKQKRDWRADDGNLNNWPKRDVSSTAGNFNRTPTKGQQRQSISRSRSRSPAESYYSRRSSRGQSRSRSPSPKRKWRDSSPIRARSRTPDRGRAEWKSRQSRKVARSPASSHHSQDSRGARRSMSSLSTTSGSRSRSSSRSPDRPKVLHRLPTATSIKDIPLSVSKAAVSRGSGMLPPQQTPHRNGKFNNRVSNRFPSSNQSSEVVHDIPVLQPSSPTVIAPATVSADNRTTSTSSATAAPPTDYHLGAPTHGSRLGSIKSAGFKPIGQTSSAVKRFFPGDDDDSDVTPPTAQLRTRSYVKSVDDDQRGDIQNDYRSRRDSDAALPSSQYNDNRRWTEAPGAHSDHPPDILDSHPLQLSTKSPLRHRISRQSSVHDDSGLHSETRNGDPGHPQDTTATPKLHSHSQGINEITRPPSPVDESSGELYAIVSQVGEGTFGKVYKARNTVTKVHVALKRIRMEAERDGFPVTAMREIKLLQSLRHENVVRLYEMMVSSGSVYMVFEYMDHDLTGVLSQTQFSFTDAHLKSLCQQMLAGLGYLHHKGVIHRDIKGSNILINNRGELKLADFGLARFYQKRRRSDYTNRVITLWYRPPELLFGATVYGPEVDMWSAGCIMLELFTKKPIFQGNDEIHQLEVIYRIFGTPTPERWPGLADLPWYELIKPKEVIPNHFRELFHKWLSPAALDLAEKLLSYDPAQRVTAVQAMETAYFRQEEPAPALPIGLSTLEGEWHELETKRERAKKRRRTEGATQ